MATFVGAVADERIGNKRGEAGLPGVTSFEVLNLMNDAMSQWLMTEGLIRMSGSCETGQNEEMVYVFDPTEKEETVLHSSVCGTVSSGKESVEEYGVDLFMGRFVRWIDEVYDLSVQVAQDFDVTTVDIRMYEQQIETGKKRFAAMEDQYVSGVLTMETAYTDESGEDNTARIEWEFLPIQVIDNLNGEETGEIYLFYRETEIYPDNYCTETIWLLVDEEFVKDLQGSICDLIQQYGNVHGVYRFAQ